mgnify:CR=1 FL=1
MNNIWTAQQDITEMTGSENWDDVVEWFGGRSEAEILAELNRCISEDTQQLAALAHDIHEEIERDAWRK